MGEPLSRKRTTGQGRHVGKPLKRGCLPIHDKFLQGATYRSSQLDVGWTEET